MPFLAGVIEGFYGPPWTKAERLALFDWLADWGLNTYLYAPKDDLNHRALWREPYPADAAQELAQLIRDADEKKLQFIYALSPGLDIRYQSASDLECLKQRFDQMLAMGCRHFCLLFDDIPDRMEPADLQQFGSLASAQAAVTNELFRWLRQRQAAARFLFCPTPYCGRMAERKHGGEGYLATIGRELLPEIDVFWTGPEIISREITLEHIREVGSTLRRKPLIWDNLHANDYDGRRFFCGPYAGRPREMLGAVSGVLNNPNCEFPLNYVPLRTLAEFTGGKGVWDPRAAYLQALEGWKPAFATIQREADLSDLTCFGDCYYLPHEEGPSAEKLYRLLHDLLSQSPAEWGGKAAEFCRQAARLREFCVHLPELKNRALFHALCRRVWELREELDLLERYIAFRTSAQGERGEFRSDFHLPGTYRGGLVARLQRLLVQHADETFTAASTNNEPGFLAEKSSSLSRL
jgi:protein O-GlcNAcase/histone acetyltransferase